MADTAIEWATKVWNPSTGCDQISPGCDNCYALAMARRLKAMGQVKYQLDGDPRTSGPGFGLAVHPDSLSTPLSWPGHELVFVNSMSDLFHARVPREFAARVWAVMAMAERHTFQVLTKRPERMRSLLTSPQWAALIRDALSAVTDTAEAPMPAADYDRAWSWAHGPVLLPEFLAPLPNVWLGTSIETDEYCRRADELRETPAAVRFLSLEPLLGPLPSLNLDGIGWVIAGGESGPNARPVHPDWLRAIRDACVAAGVPFFLKQFGAFTPYTPKTADGQPDWDRAGVWVSAETGEVVARESDVPASGSWQQVWRVGKKAAGRELDGEIWDQFPAEPAVVANG